MKVLQESVDAQKAEKGIAADGLEVIQKQIESLQEKGKKESDEIDKLKNQRAALQDEYYGALIEFQKYNYLKHDIEWMTEMQQKLLDSDKIKKEREAKKQELIEKRKAE